MKRQNLYDVDENSSTPASLQVAEQFATNLESGRDMRQGTGGCKICGDHTHSYRYCTRLDGNLGNQETLKKVDPEFYEKYMNDIHNRPSGRTGSGQHGSDQQQQQQQTWWSEQWNQQQRSSDRQSWDNQWQQWFSSAPTGQPKSWSSSWRYGDYVLIY